METLHDISLISSSYLIEPKQIIKATKEPSTSSDGSTTPYVPWGADNAEPTRIREKVQGCGVLNSTIDAKARITIGRGPRLVRVKGYDKKGDEIMDYVEPNEEPEAWNFLETNDIFKTGLDICKNLFTFAISPTQIIKNAEGKISGFKAMDAFEMRLERMKNATIEKAFFSSDWQPADALAHSLQLPVIPDYNPVDFLKNHKGSHFVLLHRHLSAGERYYPRGAWKSAENWVDIARSVPLMKASMFKNQMNIKYVIVIAPQYWTDQFGVEWQGFTVVEQLKHKKDLIDKIEKSLRGDENSNKSIFTSGYTDPMTKQFTPHIQVNVIDDKMKDGKFLPDSGAANAEIMFALMMNPALIGADMPGGPYSSSGGSGSNIREAYLVQIMLHELERKMISQIFTLAKHVNGWNNALQLRYQGLILTTLDTGKSTKQENLG